MNTFIVAAWRKADSKPSTADRARMRADVGGALYGVEATVVYITTSSECDVWCAEVCSDRAEHLRYTLPLVAKLYPAYKIQISTNMIANREVEGL